VRAWRWNFGRLAVIRAQRKALQANRRVADKEIRLLQVRGSARLSAYLRRVFQFGFHGAHADELAATAVAEAPSVPLHEVAEEEAGVGPPRPAGSAGGCGWSCG
jgi:hypothetical protein